MVMEESPSPQIVGREFVRQYYTLLNKAPIHLHRFYNNVSSFVHGGLDAPDRETAPVIGQKEIHNRIQQLNFRDCHAKISQVDSQATLGSGVVVQVTGELSNGGQPMRRFTQTFVLAMQNPKQYYVHNDIFRYQDFVFNDEDSEWEYSRPEEVSVTASMTTSTPAVLQQPLPAPYFPPPSTLPPVAPLTPLVAHTQINHPTLAPVESISPPPSLPHRLPHHLQKPAAPVATHNGHQEDSQANLSMPLSASDSSCGEVEMAGQEFEPEVEVVTPTPPPPQQQTPALPVHEPAPVIVSTEPKTYANLVKSGPPGSFAQAIQQSAPAVQNVSTGRVPSSLSRSEPSPASQPQSATPVTPPAPQRPRPPRQPRSDSITESSSGQTSGNTPPSSSSAPARRYSDSHQLFLGNVPHSATKEELRTLFEKFGAIADIRVYNKAAGPPGSATGPGGRMLPNYAFLTFEDSQSAQNCLNYGPLYFPSEDSEDGHLLNVQEKKSRPSGGGGGGGGGGGRGGGGGGRGGPRLPRPAFSRTPYQPQRR